MNKFLILGVVFLAACTQQFEGTYSAVNGMYLRFTPNGEVLTDLPNFGAQESTGNGESLFGRYTKDGNQIKITTKNRDGSNGSEALFTVNDSGSITAGPLGVLVKK